MIFIADFSGGYHSYLTRCGERRKRRHIPYVTTSRYPEYNDMTTTCILMFSDPVVITSIDHSNLDKGKKQTDETEMSRANQHGSRTTMADISSWPMIHDALQGT
jgi:hypothetical protein